MIRISYNTISLNRDKVSNGYGYAGSNIVSSLRALGHEVDIDNPDSHIQFYFCQPDYIKSLNPDRHNIIYTPWESSHVKRGWVFLFNQADEIWTTSQKCAEWYRDAGVVKPIYVYQHGIEPAWKKLKRVNVAPIKFLHIGEPAPRKGGQMVLDAFRTAFSSSRDVHLTIKAYTHNTTRVYQEGGFPSRPRSILGLPSDFPNISVSSGDVSFTELVAIYQNHDVLVYPSWGEGFGFIPIQGLATGMPTICTGEWAPYRQFLGPLELDSREVDSPWPLVHPGSMFEPSYDHLVSLMRQAVADFDSISDFYYAQADAVHDAYDWLNLTREAFAHLETV